MIKENGELILQVVVSFQQLPHLGLQLEERNPEKRSVSFHVVTFFSEGFLKASGTARLIRPSAWKFMLALVLLQEYFEIIPHLAIKLA